MAPPARPRRVLPFLLVGVLLLPLLPVQAAPSEDPAAATRLLGGEVFVYDFDADDHNVPSAGKTRDASGRGNHGTLANIQPAAGAFGNAYQFRVASSTYIEVPNAATSNQPDGTIMMWFQASSHAGRHLFLKVKPGISGDLDLTYLEDGRVLFRTAQYQGSTFLVSATKVPFNTWTHVAATWGPAGKRIYINGALDAADSDTVGVGWQATRAFLGNDPNYACCQGLDGRIDQVRFYDRALAPAEIRSLKDFPYGSGSVPLSNDQDDDGMTDADELARGTDPYHPDTDRDGIPDRLEIFSYGTDPKKADTDGDGLSDFAELYDIGSSPWARDTDGDTLEDPVDPDPLRESVAPHYPGGNTFITLHADGYIDLVIDDPGASPPPVTVNARPPDVCIRFCTDPGATIHWPSASAGQPSVHALDVAAVLLTGKLTAETAQGPLPEPVHFAIFAQKGDGHVWAARYPMPPGITRVTREEITIVAIDPVGNRWTASQTFTQVLQGNVWSETFQPTANATGWDYILDHTADVPSAGGGGAVTFQLLPEFVPHPDDPSLAIAPGEPFQQQPPGSPTRSAPPQTITLVRAQDWEPRLTLDTNPLRLKQGLLKTAAAVAADCGGCPAEQSAETILGFTLVGSADACLVGLNPGETLPDDFELLMAAIGCAEVVMTALPPTPHTMAARGAIMIARSGMKAVATDPKALRAFAGSTEICIRSAGPCKDARHTSLFVIADPANRAGPVSITSDALGPSTMSKLAVTDGRLAMNHAAVSDLKALQKTDPEVANVLRKMSVPSKYGPPEASVAKGFTLHKGYRESQRLTEAESASFLEDLAGFFSITTDPGIGDVGTWLEAAKLMSDEVRRDGPRGFAYRADVMDRYLDVGQLTRVNKMENWTTSSGRQMSVTILAARASPGGHVVLEAKAADYTTADTEHMTRLAQFLAAAGVARGYAKSIEFRTTGAYDATFKAAAQEQASRYGVTIRLLDAQDGVVAAYP